LIAAQTVIESELPVRSETRQAMTVMKTVLTALALVVLGAFALAGAQDVHQSPTPPLVIKSTYGADLYKFYCSNCHGVTAHGSGAVSPLHLPAPDLTALARHNGGIFPRERIRDSITFGPGVAKRGAHGTADMPVWGTVFRGLEKNDTMTAIRIENIVNYLASLQETPEGR
jgi:mono/diheme cytochrome c family protein